MRIRSFAFQRYLDIGDSVPLTRALQFNASTWKYDGNLQFHTVKTEQK